ncbi:two component transcriptional regulator, LytTR family [Marinobacter daqiaonensis]|uniref:Two component transcriptional regulator, LytTR family n=1 Tax=Marinobacter daqiaonensis TaxID=650891 RepID=A0A1I6JTY4_9GAMM|nr:LytTR family DNA-binding domain-containing protein [Marinobacter daqiaonensis]SFR82475.1 two component transcriptional regulator, LytTR family [Marinobacter daqiaonensis]
MTTPIRVLIADDEPLARERLSRLVSDLEGYRVCGEAASGDQVLSAVVTEMPDILLLDIRMPGGDGMAVARQLAAQSDPPAIIFCTAYDEYAIRAFEVQAAAYLLKPVRRDALAEALARAERVNRAQLRALKGTSAAPEGHHLTVSSARGTELVDMTRVTHCEADQKYVTLHHRDGESLTDLSLKALESRFPEELLRIHRNTLVGTRYIRSLDRQSDGSYQMRLEQVPDPLPVSRRHTARVRQWLSERGDS